MSAEPVAGPLLPVPIARRVITLAPISLDDLEATAALLTRTDRKYVISWALLAATLDAIEREFSVLEIAGRRLFTYRSRYFDSPTLAAFRAHIQGRRLRFKCRVRHYVDSDRYVFEVKLRGTRGETVKHQLTCAADAYDAIAEPVHAFAADCVGAAYGKPVGDLRPSLETRYRRMTLVARGGGERVTVDHAVRFDNGSGAWGALQEGYVILETKGGTALSATDRALRRLGAQPVSCTKYCVGIGLLHDELPVSDLRRLLRRYFDTQSPLPPVR